MSAASNATNEQGVEPPPPNSENDDEMASVVDVKNARFAPLADAPLGADGPIGGMDLLHDVPLQIAVELGRARLPVRDILSLQQGSVIELDRMAGEPVDVLVNGRMVARGEVVVIEDKFGIRILELVQLNNDSRWDGV